MKFKFSFEIIQVKWYANDNIYSKAVILITLNMLIKSMLEEYIEVIERLKSC